MKKVMFYCQHILGLGHLMRSVALVQGLKDFQVCFINGGEAIPGFEFPPDVQVVQLPPLKADADFRGIESVNDQSLTDIEAARKQLLLAEFERFQPDVLIIELFPFGRKKFSFELVPLLARNRVSGKPAKVICSLRDIMVRRDNQASYEARVVHLVRRFFDAILVHADPQFQRLEETFHRAGDLEVPVVYTGYVNQETPIEADPDAPERTDGEPLILVSIGGGRVGYELVLSAIRASARLQQELSHQMLIFTGPFLAEDQMAELRETSAGQEQVTLRTFTKHFQHTMTQASLSVSLAGYNTCMNILTAGTPALVLPFTGGGNDEQTIRARKLEELGLVGVLEPQDLEPAVLAERMKQHLQKERRESGLDMEGVANTATFLQEIPIASAPPPPLDFPTSKLRAALDQMQSEQKQVHIFVRDDDVDEDEETLHQLLDLSLANGVPLNLQVVPGRLTDAATELLKDHYRLDPALLELNQHGWMHLNHEENGRKCEFGPSRTFDQQLADITQGKEILANRFGKRFHLVFTPPWNRCTETTYLALDQLGFSVLSKDQDPPGVTGYHFREVSITLDIFRWRGGVQLKTPDEIVGSLCNQLSAGDPIGIVLHHKIMDATAFALTDQLFRELRRSPMVQFHTFRTLTQLLEPAFLSEGLNDSLKAIEA